jgi:hypothetical protein
LWAGINSSPQGSAFIAGSGYNYEVEHAQAMAAMKNMPWEEWVKLYAKYHHCGEKGHIRPDCPKYLQKIKPGKIIHGPKHQRPGPCGSPLSRPPGRGLPSSHPPGRAAPRCDFMKEPKAKAFLLAFQALFMNDENDNEEEYESNENQDGDADNNQEADDDVRTFLSLAGSLKE